MKKSLFILAAVLFPTLLSAQSALQQLESMAGQSIHDVHVPDPGDPVPVDPDPEEEPQQSTHLQDYTPMQETTPSAPAPQTQQQPASDGWAEYLQREQERQNKVNKILNEKRADYKKDLEEEEARIARRYERFLTTQPMTRPVPQFSGRGERNFMFDHPMTVNELRGSYGKYNLSDYNDTLFRADYLRYPQPGASGLQSNRMRFLGTRLANGRVEWRMFREEWDYSNFDDPYDNLTAYYEKRSLPGNSKIQSKDIWDVKMAAEGEVIILEMKNGNNVVIRPNGTYLCEGKHITFPARFEEGVFVECDGKLYCTNAPEYSGSILSGDEFQYFGRTIIVQNHDANNQPYYRLATYSGKCYDIQKHQWTQGGNHDQYTYLARFTNDGDHFIAQPKGKDYYVILAYWGGLFKGQKKYKTIEEAHAAWAQEKQYISRKGDKHQEQAAKLK